MDLLQHYHNDDELDEHGQNPNSSPDSSSPPRLLPSKSAAPKVDDTMLALTVANQTLSKPIDPVQHAVAFNPTYDQLWAPELGPAHPYAKDGIAQGMRNHKLGFVENAAIDSFCNNYVGDLDTLEKTNGISVYNIPQHEQKKRKIEKKREVTEEEGDGDDVMDKEEVENPATDAWLMKNRKSPWAGKRRDYKLSCLKSSKNMRRSTRERRRRKLAVRKVGAHMEWAYQRSPCYKVFPKYGHLILSAGMDTKVKIWDVFNSGKCMRTYMGHSKAVRDISFCNDGTKFLTASYDKNIKYWDTETGQVISTFSTGKIPYVVKLNPDDDKQNILLAGMSDKKIVQWDMNSGQITQEYDQHLGAVNTITFVDNNRRFVTSSDDKSLRVWEFGIPVVIKYISEPHMHSMPAISLHPNSNWLAAQSLDNQILIYSTRERFQLNKKKRFAGHIVAGYACQVNFSPDGRFVMSGDGEGKCWFWDWKSCKVFRTLKCHEGVCIGCEWHPLEQSKVATCGWDGLIKYCHELQQQASLSFNGSLDFLILISGLVVFRSDQALIPVDQPTSYTLPERDCTYPAE
ncbi:hypothetical protein H0E87_015124 [Populus deltoides]|uniref:Pre-mRNA-processing factor 17 n=1 Tax=Populus deltoides TaxID=3696 RepID=A0A8T2Y3Y7_POPDE|nr:hypothetical protein H0E87_015124 [Populus deltoides]